MKDDHIYILERVKLRQADTCPRPLRQLVVESAFEPRRLAAKPV